MAEIFPTDVTCAFNCVLKVPVKGCLTVPIRCTHFNYVVVGQKLCRINMTKNMSKSTALPDMNTTHDFSQIEHFPFSIFKNKSRHDYKPVLNYKLAEGKNITYLRANHRPPSWTLLLYFCYYLFIYLFIYLSIYLSSKYKNRGSKKGFRRGSKGGLKGGGESTFCLHPQICALRELNLFRSVSLYPFP